MFSTEEFEIMVKEVLYDESARFEMLCHIADKTLIPYIRKWCYEDPYLRRACVEEYILQDTRWNLIQHVVTRFLRRDGIDGPVNNDPKGFERWIIKIAKNVKYDYHKQIARIFNNRTDLQEGDLERIPDPENVYYDDEILEARETLSRAFEIVLDSDIKVYKVLTWLALCLFIVDLDITKIQSNNKIIDSFEKTTLHKMRDGVFECAKRITWLEMTKEQKDRIDRSLGEMFDDHRVYGEVTYGEFFMKKGGKASISDWVNKINNMIKQVIDNETSND